MIGNNIYEIRKQRGFTLSELAERAKVSKSYLSTIERNIKKNPSIEVIKKIAFVLEVDLKTLLGIENNCKVQNQIDFEWLEIINELKEFSVERENIQEYKKLIEYIKWKNDNLGENE